MTDLIRVPDNLPPDPSRPEDRARWCCMQLESGNILYFAQSPFDFPEDEIQFLLSQEQSGAGYHKNIAYRPAQDRLTGYAAERPGDVKRLHDIMRSYSQRVIRFTSELFQSYAQRWRVDFSNFRPQ
jgi:hypothetical protein